MCIRDRPAPSTQEVYSAKESSFNNKIHLRAYVYWSQGHSLMGWSDLGLLVVPSVCVDAMFVPLTLVCSLIILWEVFVWWALCVPQAPLHLMLPRALVAKWPTNPRYTAILPQKGSQKFFLPKREEPASTVAHQNPSTWCILGQWYPQSAESQPIR